MLNEKKVLLGVSGGIACYKALELTRLLVEAGASVQVVMTREAMEFVTPLSFQTLSRNRVATSLFDPIEESQIGHIRLADEAHLLVIAPATANIISKLACGLGDDLLTTIALACRAPVLIAPAMNVHMYENPIIRKNIQKLEELGYGFVGPAEGSLACGYEGRGRLVEPPVLFEEIRTALSIKDLRGERVIVTAGPTEEALDPARILTNRSSGKMGFALASACRRRGAEVVLVAGPTLVPPPPGVVVVPVSTAAEMSVQVLDRLDWSTLIVMAAAVCDYTPMHPLSAKLMKERESLTVELQRTTDILLEISQRKKGQFVVGFAAETDRLMDRARKKLRDKNLDLIVANDILQEGAGFRSDTNRVTLVSRTIDAEDLPLLSKEEAAERIIDRVVQEKRFLSSPHHARASDPACA
jgi:phosphopantothenoylcysteine decarboxylase/phosphopantothenate--cysteine ligase